MGFHPLTHRFSSHHYRFPRFGDVIGPRKENAQRSKKYWSGMDGCNGIASKKLSLRQPGRVEMVFKFVEIHYLLKGESNEFFPQITSSPWIDLAGQTMIPCSSIRTDMSTREEALMHQHTSNSWIHIVNIHQLTSLLTSSSNWICTQDFVH